MLVLSTRPTIASLLNILEYNISHSNLKGDMVVELIDMLPMEKFSWNNRLNIAKILLEDRQIDQTKKLIRNIDTIEFVQQANHPDQVKNFMELLVYTGRGDDILKLLELSQLSDFFYVDEFIDLKLDLAFKLIMQGQRQSAKNILGTFNEDIFAREEHSCLLGFTYTRLSMFDKAAYILNETEKRGYTQSDLYFYKALLFYCLGNIDEAENYIDKHISLKTFSHPNLHWKAKFLNSRKHHKDALYHLEALLTKLGDNTTLKCAGLIEKGNTYRMLGLYEKSLFFYQEAHNIFHIPVFWSWIACFEYAMTLIYLDKYEDALNVAQKGCSFNFNLYNERYNPCLIFYNFLLYHQNQSKIIIDSSSRHVKDIRLWPFPFLPQHLWAQLLVVIAVENEGKTDKAEKIISRLVNDIALHSHSKNLQTRINPDNTSETLSLLSTTIFQNDFTWRVLQKLCNHNDTTERQ